MLAQGYVLSSFTFRAHYNTNLLKLYILLSVVEQTTDLQIRTAVHDLLNASRRRKYIQ